MPKFRYLILAIAVAGMLSGCSTVPVYQQKFVSQDGMIFSDSPVENASVNLTAQIESGSAVSGGGQAAGCTACR